ncbi:hypothetical protein LshimejAT787_0705720 [Lyophyllum shimeji]|uniref:GATA-type domain-containing protein n=1 Tax=Lyophyllum shimeji TaxID=47721 RepID=A0A9P3UP84_LYOSH|nr:hypothetical protein LshimejAT787_0705720 [Lyophyllum shimeji]
MIWSCCRGVSRPPRAELLIQGGVKIVALLGALALPPPPPPAQHLPARAFCQSSDVASVQPQPRCSTSVINRIARCHMCHTTATPLWRKDDEGVGYTTRFSGHDARRGENNLLDTPSASPRVSRRASPAHGALPTLVPDFTTQMNYDYIEARRTRFPGPYHPDYVAQFYAMPSSSDPPPFLPSDSSVHEVATSPRSSKQHCIALTRRASRPPPPRQLKP